MAQRVNRATRARLQAIVVCLVVLVSSWLVSGMMLGPDAVGGAVVAALIVVAFFGTGHLLQRVFLAMTDLRGLILNLVGFLVRIGVIWWIGAQFATVELHRTTSYGVAIGAVGAIVGWIGALCYEQIHAPVAIYDIGHPAPKGWIT